MRVEQLLKRLARDLNEVDRELAEGRRQTKRADALLAEAREALTRGLALHDDVEGWTRTLAP